MGISDHSRRAFVCSDTDVGWEGWACNLCKVLCGLEVSTVQASQILPHQIRSSMSLWTLMWPSPTPENQPHTIIPPSSNVTLDCTAQSDKHRCPGNFQAQTRTTDFQTEKRERAGLHGSRVRVAYFTPLHPTLGCWPWKPILLSLHTVVELIWRPWSLEVCSNCRPLHTVHLGLFLPHSDFTRFMQNQRKKCKQVIKRKIHWKTSRMTWERLSSRIQYTETLRD